MRKKGRPAKNAYEYGLYLLSFVPNSEAALKRKLAARTFKSLEISSAIEKLKTYHFIDDRRLANDFIVSQGQKGWGRKAVTAKLLQKGIPLGIITHLFSSDEIASLPEADNALRIAKKKCAAWHRISGKNMCRRLISFLVRRGFDDDTAQETAAACCEYMPQEEN